MQEGIRSADRTIVVGGLAHGVCTPGPLVPGTVVRLGCGATYCVSAGPRKRAVGVCCAAVR